MAGTCSQPIFASRIPTDDWPYIFFPILTFVNFLSGKNTPFDLEVPLDKEEFLVS